MDNHRAALWCWLQELDLEKSHSLIHIDRHSDANRSRMKTWLKYLPDWSAGIEDYLSKSYSDHSNDKYRTIKWGNYISIYLHEFGKNLKNFWCLNHEIDNKLKFDGLKYGEIWQLPESFVYWLTDNKGNQPWIVNIDLDYFYCNSENGICMMVSDDYIDAVGSSLRIAMDQGLIGVLTLCLTPGSDLTPGWRETEALAARLLKHLGLTFVLPEFDWFWGYERPSAQERLLIESGE